MRTWFRSLSAVVLVVALATATVTVARSTPVAPAGVPGPAPSLSVSTVLSGLHRPWDLAFTPGGGMLFTEKGGASPRRAAPSGSGSPRPGRCGRSPIPSTPS